MATKKSPRGSRARPLEVVQRREVGHRAAAVDGAVRWVGLVRPLPLAEGTEVLLTLVERIRSDPGSGPFAGPAVLDGGCSSI